MAGRAPNLKLERQLLEQHVVVAGSDEVGRGSLSGPVTVGVVVVTRETSRPPTGLRDSKLLTPAAREALVPRIERWAAAVAVGHASAAEIDRFGILRALRLAGERAVAALPLQPEHVILDGNYDWYTRPAPIRRPPLPGGVGPVRIEIKADLRCASVAAASVIAKVERDQLMVELAARHPGYGWEGNKGYATADHRAAIRDLGPCCEHRRSWNLGDSDQLELDLRDTAEVQR
jgi:ribonuclease HII